MPFEVASQKILCTQTVVGEASLTTKRVETFGSGIRIVVVIAEGKVVAGSGLGRPCEALHRPLSIGPPFEENCLL